MRRPDSGVILVNVLVALALGSALVTLMLTSQDNLVDRARRASAASQAVALALGGEDSVRVALRRDMIAAPETDHFAEPWAAVRQEEVVLETGRYAVEVADAQARFDLNRLAGPEMAPRQAFIRLAGALELPPQVAERIAGTLRARGPVADPADVPGVDPASMAILSPYVTALPVAGNVNLNTADAVVMGAMLQGASAARRLADRRDRTGFLTEADLVQAGLLQGGATGFRSDIWDVTVTAEVDDVTVRLVSRLLRQTRDGMPEVVVLSRRLGPDAAALPPPDPAAAL